MTILQLSPHLNVTLPHKGSKFGRAIGWVCEGLEGGFYWIVVTEDREVWITKNEEIRIAENYTLEYK